MTEIVKGLKLSIERNGELSARLHDQYLGNVVGIGENGDYIVKVLNGSFKPNNDADLNRTSVLPVVGRGFTGAMVVANKRGIL